MFDSHFVRGEYEEAENYLNKIESEICCSVWSLECRLLLAEYNHGVTGNKEFLSKFNEENEGICVYTKALAHYLSIRAEKSLSVERYNHDLRNDLNSLRGSKKKEHFDYYLFKLSFINNLEFNNYIEIVAYDFQHSIIDRYLNLRKVLTSLLTSVNKTVEKIENEKTIKIYIVNRLSYLLKKINDPILFKLKLFASERQFPAFDENESIREISIIDKYTSGLYQEVEEDLKSLIIEKPNQFDLYVLYAKSLVYQGKDFVSIGNQKSIQNKIIKELYKIISVRISPVEAGLNLIRIANNLSSSVLSYGIIDFVYYQTKGQNERKLFAKLSYNPANPIIYEIYSDVNSQLNYLELIKNKFPKSITVDFLYKKLQSPDEIEHFEKLIPETKYKTEVAKSLQRRGLYSESSQIWESLINEHKETTPILETSIRNLYYCYEQLERFDDCIRIYVDSYMSNQFIVGKIETAKLLNCIRERRFKVVKPVIELPIFYSITCYDENEIHTAFEKFNLNFGVCRPSELLPYFEQFDMVKILFYLKFTSSPEILKHSIHINGSKDRLEERLSILKFLKEKDTADPKFYEDEIKNITNILIIQKGLLELDESKIYVNEHGIISNELKDYEAVYLRFKAISKIAEKSKVWLLDKSGRLGTLNYTEESTEAEKLEYSSNPVYDVYSELFEGIKEKFLYSKFGIVAYLSTRIRHGVLIGEIRPVFEKHKLITQKEGDSASYRRNVYWDGVYKTESDLVKAKVQDILKDFSYSVDGLIYDLIKKYLQVKEAQTNPDGWFDYDFKDESLFWFSIRALKTKDFSDFAKQAFEILWEKTDTNLQLIREKIQIDISSQFNELFDKLEIDLSLLLGPNKSEVIIKSIKACSTETQNVIRKVSSWFKRSGTATSDFELENLIDIVLEHCNKTHPSHRVNLRRVTNFSCLIKGEFYTHFADLLRIFIENILKHADEKTYVIDATISTEKEDNFLIVSIENKITNTNSILALKNVWGEKTMNITKLVEEGKSGYHKAFKILNSDLKHDGNKLWTQVNDELGLFTVSMGIRLNEIKK